MGSQAIRSVGLTDQLMHLVRQKCTIDGRDFENSSIVSSTNILEKWVSRFLM